VNQPLEILAVVVVAFMSTALLTTHIAVGYFDRDGPLLRLVSGRQQRKGHSNRGRLGLDPLVVLIPIFALTVGVLQAALIVGALTLELPINRLICGLEIIAACAWIYYLATRPRQAPPNDGDT
jgi:hypothetical protein